MDCFICGTVPIYWGCNTIEKFFDSKGILHFDTMEELNSHISRISKNPFKSIIL